MRYIARAHNSKNSFVRVFTNAGYNDGEPTLLALLFSSTAIQPTMGQLEADLAVARKLKVTRGDLAQANYLSATARLEPGAVLVIPRQPAFVPTPVATLASIELTPHTEPESEIAFASGRPAAR